MIEGNTIFKNIEPDFLYLIIQCYISKRFAAFKNAVAQYLKRLRKMNLIEIRICETTVPDGN